MRPTPKRLFLLADRIPEVHFYTSNVGKFLQARTLFDLAGIRLHHFKAQAEPYSERYDLGKDELLSRAVYEVADRIGRDHTFFVEDTSMRLEALSSETDVPGLRVKEWFQETSFETLDKTLRELGNDRRAVVKSDIALHVPGLGRPIFFRGETRGVVAEAPASVEEPTRYPWLAPDTFNGWFIPDGAAATLSDLDLELSFDFDFRAKAILHLLDRLEEYASQLNAPSASVRRRQNVQASGQHVLFDEHNTPPLIVIGGTCAGKTTFAERAIDKHGRRHVEASSIVRLESGLESQSGQDALQSAKNILERAGPDMVARQIVRLYGDALRSDFVLTGFRTIEELLHFCSAVPEARVILVEASERTRFERHLKRGRYKEASTAAAFQQLDEGQFSFGLLRVARDLADLVLENEDALAEYHTRVDAILSEPWDKIGMREVRRLPDFRTRQQRSRLYRCLRVLDEEISLSLNSREISDRTAEKGTRRIVTRNVNEELKHYPELALRQEARGEQIRYQITPAGRAYVRFTDLRANASGSASAVDSSIEESAEVDLDS